MMTQEITLEDGTIKDILTNENDNKVFLIVDNNLKRIWTYNGLSSPFKLQIYGSILAQMLVTQLKLFYRVLTLNLYDRNDKRFQEILNNPIHGNKAKPILKEDFEKSTYGLHKATPDISLIQNVDVNKAIEYIEEISKLEKFVRKFLIVSGTVYTDEEVTEAFIKEEKTIKKPLKLGRLNRGFTFFDDDYSTRLIINNRRIQGIELYLHKDAKPRVINLNIPLFEDEKFSNSGDMNVLRNSFQIPDEISENIGDQELD